ncbi:MAG: HAMP domain-containing protein [Ardenticatenaceae bacterium]|nr:HAMP domain-containing protein [Ardenticatenaceae bacterium]
MQRAAGEKLEAVSAIKTYQIENYLVERESAAQATADLVNMLRQEAFARLETLRDARRSALVTLFNNWQNDLLTLSINPQFAEAAAQFVEGFQDLGPERARALYSFKPNLADAGDDSSFTAVHAQQHNFLADFAEIHEYEDLLLIDSTGMVVYSVKKGGDFGLNLAEESSNLSTVYQQLNSVQAGETAVTDITLFDDEVVMFMGTPIYDGTVYVGLLVIQLPLHKIDAVMQVPDDMESFGEIYLVGADKRMRSRSALDPENRSVEASLMGSVEKNGVDTPASQAALAGVTGVDMFVNYHETHSVSAYAPLGVPGLNWAIIVEENVAEAIVPRVEGSGMYILTQYAQRYGYQDVLLMAQDGYVFHTVMRGPDYQTNLLTGPYKDTHLGHLAQEVMKTGELGFADFSPYLPAGNKPVAFVAAPVIYEGRTEMVVAFQLPPGWTDAVMQERTGMGETGETLLVGPDMRMRSNSYLDSAEHSVEASFVGTIEKNGIDNEAVREALAGETGEGVQFGTDYLGQRVILTYAPVKFGSQNWALIAKQNVNEAFSLIAHLTGILFLAIGITVTFVTLVTLWAANRLAEPIFKLTDVAQAVATGNLDVVVPIGTNRRDELGILANAFNSMTQQLKGLVNELEQRVDERTAELEAANKELESFAYSVSHDLRTPLRAINGYTNILVEDYEPLLGVEGQRVCGVIRQQAERMGQLIDDLLAFSRLGRAEIRTDFIDMEMLANKVFDELKTEGEQVQIDFHMAALPEAVADPAMLRQVWVNLLSNAIKFSAKRERAVVDVGYSQEAAETIYYVRDNGAGFDMQYADKLFGVFQRLHSEREFPGTGVGLAIVQRIIHRHGGRVWAEGAIDQGAAFYFTLPQKGDG